MRGGMNRDAEAPLEDEPARDERAGKPPARDPGDPQTGSGEGEGATDEAPGPYGNPEVDEESLRHRQQERRRAR